MVDAMISRVRLRDLARLGRSRLPHAGVAGARTSRPETGDSVASTI